MLKSGLFLEPKVLKAVDGVSFSIEKGRTMGLVGESGCGKTMMGRTIFKLYQAAADQILYQGTDITEPSNSQMVPYRKEIQMIFQDPYTSLDPRKNIGNIIAEPIRAMELRAGEGKNDHVRKLTEMVDLRPDHINRYPHEFLGGQRQRIGIARVLVAEPEFVVCDEPISALDIPIQAQVINILEELQDRFHFMYLSTSHDLSTVHHISSEVGVIYLGDLIEYAQVDGLHGNMLHPYTQSLISTVLVANPKLARENKRIILEGDMPSPINPAPDCPSRSRCRYAKGIHSQTKPELRTVSDKHKMACHLSDQANEARLTWAEAQG